MSAQSKADELRERIVAAHDSSLDDDHRSCQAILMAIIGELDAAHEERRSELDYEALLEDAAEWSKYVQVDTAHCTLEKHLIEVFEKHGIKAKQ